MKKKLVALLLSAAMIATSAVPAVAAEFSDGGQTRADTTYGENYNGESNGTASLVNDFMDGGVGTGVGTKVSDDDAGYGDVAASAEENISTDASANVTADVSSFTDEAGLPVLEDVPGVDVAAAEDKIYTINFDAEIVLDQTQEFVRLLNIERAKLGYPPAQIDQQMMEEAIKRAPEAAVHFGHQDPITGLGVGGECLARGQETAKEFLENFRTSSAHWNYLINKDHTRIGVAICKVKADLKALHFPLDYSFMSVHQDTIFWNEFKPYSGSYKNYKQKFSQGLNSKYFKGLSGECITQEPLDIGDKVHVYPKVIMDRDCHEIISISGGFWKSMNPDVLSVNQDGIVTALAPGNGDVRYYLEKGSDEFTEYSYYVTGNPSKPIVKKPSTPKLTAVPTGYTSAKLTWNKTPNTKGYQIYRYNSKTKKYDRIKTLKGASATSYTDSLGYAKEAKYKVRAYNTGSDGKNVNGSYSSVKSVKTAAATPTITGISNSTKTKLKISWKKAAGAEGYQVYRRTGKTGSYTRVKTITSGGATSYTNGSLKKGTTYYYKMRSYRKGADGKTIYGKWSKVVYKTSR